MNSFNDKTKQIWLLIKSFKRNITDNNETTQDPRDASLEIISKICPFSYCDCSKTLEAMKSEDSQSSCICIWLDDSLPFEEFKNAINSVRKNSVPGLDQISYKMLEQIPIEFETYLLSIFNEIFSKDRLLTFLKKLPSGAYSQAGF